MEEKKEVKTYEVNYKCDECDTGYMEFGGIVLTSNPAQYPHSCDNKDCDATMTFRGEKYPQTRYETIETESNQEFVDFKNAFSIVDEIVTECANNNYYTDSVILEKIEYDSENVYLARKYYSHIGSAFLNVYLNRLHEIGTHNKDYITNARKLVGQLKDDLDV